MKRGFPVKQGKVSMVIPCYNKVEYIGEMFDSIIAQEWDSIELILVNDGSTDGTREVIAEYEPKFVTRGYEVIIVDQQNAGVCAAVKNGLERVAGDYVCVVDSDDELDPKYASIMAGWLDNNKEYDFTACGADIYTGVGENKKFSPFITKETIQLGGPYIVENWLLAHYHPMTWVYMIRVEYLQKCCIIETYNTDTKGSHEPGFCVPLLAYGGRSHVFSNPLYRFNMNGEGHSRFNQFEKARNFCEDYYNLTIKAIDSLSNSVVDAEKRDTLKQVALFGKYLRMNLRTKVTVDGHVFEDEIFNKLINMANDKWNISPPLTLEMVAKKPDVFILALRDKLIGKYESISLPSKINGRIVGYGAMGKVAGKILPQLQRTLLEPTVLWDKNGDGTSIELPDVGSLTEDDVVLVFPKGEIGQQICRELECVPSLVICNGDLYKWIAYFHFGYKLR